VRLAARGACQFGAEVQPLHDRAQVSVLQTHARRITRRATIMAALVTAAAFALP